jgi:hypothetical protein
MNVSELQAMREELEKWAAPMGLLRRAARFVTDSSGRGALVGAGVGAASGAVKAKAEGGDAGDAVRGAIVGGLGGAALGGVAGGAGRAYRDTRLLDPALTATSAIGATAKRMGQGVSNFGRRQLHGVTGAYSDRPGEIGLRSSGTAAKKVDLAERRLQDRLVGSRSPQQSLDLHKKFQQEKKHLLEEGQRGDSYLKAGITSLPGLAKGLATAPKKTVKALWNEATSGSRLGVAASTGLPLALAAPGLAAGDESAQGGLSVRQKMTRLGTGLAGGLLTGGLPIVPQMATGLAIDLAGDRAAGIKGPPVRGSYALPQRVNGG